MGKKPKTYDRLRFNSGQHRRILLVSLLLGCWPLCRCFGGCMI